MKIIAELCQNHNGDLSTLDEMVQNAVDAGATHVKIQHIYPEILNYRPRHEHGIFTNNKQVSFKRPYKTEFDRLSKLVLSEKSILAFIDKCLSNNVTPLITCFSRSDINYIKSLGFKEIKIASYDCSSYPMLREVADNFEHVYVSTGATFDREVEYAVSVLNNKNTDFSLLQCTTIYPTPLKLINLSRLLFLKSLINKKNNIGFSDHSSNSSHPLLASMLAIFHGSKIIERHFSILPTSETKDGPVSINTDQLRQLVEFSSLDNSKQLEYLNNLNINPYDYIDETYTDRGLSDEESLNRDYYKGRFATVISREKGLPKYVITNFDEVPINT